MGGVAQDLLGDRVQALHVGDRVHHHDVGRRRHSGRRRRRRRSRPSSSGCRPAARRMPAVASEVPPEPPAEMMPPMSRWRTIQRAKASAIASTDWPRSPVKTADGAARMHARHLLRRHIGARRLAGGREIDGARPDAERRSRSRMNFSSRPLVSKVPTTSAVRPCRSASGIAKTLRRLVAAGCGACRRPPARIAESTGTSSGSAVR